MAFTPKKKSTIKDEIKKLFLDGKVIKHDGYQNFIQVYERNIIPDCAGMGNLNREDGGLFVDVANGTFYDIVEELEKEYSVVAVNCENSGCCQYNTYCYWLE